MNSKRIVIFSWVDSVHVRRWVNGLSSRGYNIKVISLGGTAPEGSDAVILPRSSRLSYFTQASRAASEARRFKPDLVHVHYAAGFGIWGLKCGIKPLVVSVWGSDLFKFPSNPINRYIIRRTLNGATHITATSRMLEKLTVQLAPKTSHRMSIIPFGVEIPSYLPVMDPTEQLKLCFVKSHKPIYGADLLLKAMVQVRERFPNVLLSMAGDGPITDDLKRLAEALNLSENVTFTGRIDHEKIQEFIAGHHLMIMPSHMESFGVAVLDAAAAGRPTIATNVGGIPEVIRDGETGWLVPPDDEKALAEAIIKAGCDTDKLRHMGERAYQLAKDNFTWERSLDMMSELYERLIHEQKKQR